MKKKKKTFWEVEPFIDWLQDLENYISMLYFINYYYYIFVLPLIKIQQGHIWFVIWENI